MRIFLIAVFSIGMAAQSWASPKQAHSPAVNPPLSVMKFRNLLQSFVDKTYLTAFRHLGDERDFDHAHILFDPITKIPQAILYHTQELAGYYPPGSGYEYIDPKARNWIQWIDKPAIENARAYERNTFPDSAYWAWFVARKLPSYKKAHTIVDKMLDPLLVGATTEESLQWVFTRVECGLPPAPSEPPMMIVLPDGQEVCLTLS